MEAQLPLTWKGLNVDHYNGITNLDKHVDVYTTQISLYTSNDSLPTSLKVGTLSWVTRLPPSSIDCIETLMSKFGTQFVTSRAHHLSSIALVNIQQEKGVPL